MLDNKTSPFHRLLSLTFGLRKMPPGPKRILVALSYGLVCQTLFALAVSVMIIAMFFGMTESFGAVSKPWSYAANLFLLLQFPFMHSILLSKRGSRFLNFLVPSEYAGTLNTTSYAIFASIQLLALFTLWTSSGVVWWRAEGYLFYIMCLLYASSWALLIKASYEAGAEVQSGALGWMSLAQDKKPVFPDMPTRGLFSIIRQPIYVSFALTLWTVPVWTPDQLALAIVFTGYCLLAPKFKEARFEKRYGARFRAYRARVPYALPRLKASRYLDNNSSK
tara:strand:+ start:1273 stop:2106 length:834 start_codon:yes stop_codon:yes gene_type:complete